MCVCLDDWTAEWSIIASNVTASKRELDVATGNAFNTSKWMS